MKKSNKIKFEDLEKEFSKKGISALDGLSNKFLDDFFEYYYEKNGRNVSQIKSIDFEKLAKEYDKKGVEVLDGLPLNIVDLFFEFYYKAKDEQNEMQK